MQFNDSNIKRTKGRDAFCISYFAEVLSYLRFKSTLKILSFTFPAFLISCRQKDQGLTVGNVLSEIDLSVKSAQAEGALTLDVLAYNLDSLQKLDSYTRTEYTGLPSRRSVSSRGGRKMVVVLANWPEEDLEWGGISSLENLYRVMSNLESDKPSRPRMSGTATINAGSGAYSRVSLQTLSARIYINSISCDFSGRSYEGEPMKDVKVYLTNVCTSTSFSPDDASGATYLNLGGLSEGDMKSFGNRDLIYSEIEGEIGPGAIYPGIYLYCYPYAEGEDGRERSGQPSTKLVVEGSIGGRKYYYPIALGEYTGGGLRRDTTYSVDIKITRLGADEQDTAVSQEAFQVAVSTEPWEENERQVIDF